MIGSFIAGIIALISAYILGGQHKAEKIKSQLKLDKEKNDEKRNEEIKKVETVIYSSDLDALVAANNERAKQIAEQGDKS